MPTMQPQYLKPLCKNDLTTAEINRFRKKIRYFPPLEIEEKDVSYDTESLFTNVPSKETVNYILHQICVQKVLPQICSRLILKTLLMTLQQK